MSPVISISIWMTNLFFSDNNDNMMMKREVEAKQKQRIWQPSTSHHKDLLESYSPKNASYAALVKDNFQSVTYLNRISFWEKFDVPLGSAHKKTIEKILTAERNQRNEEDPATFFHVNISVVECLMLQVMWILLSKYLECFLTDICSRLCLGKRKDRQYKRTQRTCI